MINLLPTQEKEHLAFEEHKRMIIIITSVIGVSLICLALLLTFVKVGVLKAGLAEETTAQGYRQEYQNPAYVTVKNTITHANIAFTQAQKFYNKQVYLSDAVYMVSEIKKSAGVHILHINWELVRDKAAIAVTVAGISTTRGDLIAFRDAMNNFSWGGHKKILQNVNFPPESWTKPKEISFQVTFQIPINEIKR